MDGLDHRWDRNQFQTVKDEILHTLLKPEDNLGSEFQTVKDEILLDVYVLYVYLIRWISNR